MKVFRAELIKIELSSHTDSRAAVNYIIASGIGGDRLTWRGYGESKPVNKCVNNVVCTEEEHQANRRTEFKVTKIGLTAEK